MSMRDLLISGSANVLWNVFQSVNTRLKENASPHPSWAPGPLPKSHERSKPVLDFPAKQIPFVPNVYLR